MPLNDEQQAALERLHENTSLTDNLTDEPARALLAWAEQQIRAGRPADEVSAALRAANRSGASTSAAALAAAQAALPPTQPAPAADQPAPGASEQRAAQQPAGAGQAGPAHPPPASRPPDRQAALGSAAPRPISRWSRLRRWLFGRQPNKH